MNKEEKTKAVLKSVQTINFLADLILIEYQQELVEKPYSLPVLNMKAKRIKQDATDIKKELSRIARVLHPEETEEHMFEMWRVMNYFSLMSVVQLKDFMDRIEALPSEEAIDTIQTL